uniref:Uncharacterized protein n=1 Tax=Anguilla anguilla TaxID=7936 RepID=A0A0E9UD22_ANGAN
MCRLVFQGIKATAIPFAVHIKIT